MQGKLKARSQEIFMRKALQFLVLFGIVGFVLVFGGEWIGQTEDRTYGDNVLTNQIDQEQLISVSLIVEEARYEVKVAPGSSVYDVLVAAQEQGLSFKGREFSGMGYFVEELNGKAESNRQRMHWIYSINNKKAEVGVSNYIIQLNDVISWSYESEY